MIENKFIEELEKNEFEFELEYNDDDELFCINIRPKKLNEAFDDHKAVSEFINFMRVNGFKVDKIMDDKITFHDILTEVFVTFYRKAIKK